MRYIVTLVHGTFAKDAAWTQEGSLLRVALEKRLGAPVTFRTVGWSGRNTMRARMQGAQELVKELHHQMKDPDALLFVIAHSHGGNVALHAMRDPQIRLRVAGVVTISTPFVVVSRRTSVYWDAGLIFGGLVPYAAAATLALYLILRAYSAVAPSLALLAAAFGFAAVMVLAAWIVGKLEDQSNVVEEELRFPPLDDRQVLILRTAGDEAFSALAFNHFLALVPYRFFVASANFVDHLELRHHQTLARMATVLCGIAFGPFVIAAWLSQLALNLDPFGSSPFLDITAEATPPGKWTVQLCVRDRFEMPHVETLVARAARFRPGQRDPLGGSTASTLLHSHQHTHWESLAVISDWIEARRHSIQGQEAVILQQVPST